MFPLDQWTTCSEGPPGKFEKRCEYDYSLRATIGVLIAFFGLAGPGLLYADVLELKSGQKVEGQFVGGSREEIRFQVGSQALKFPIAEVTKITIGSAGQEDFYKAAKEALRQLKALASITEGGTTYQNYSTRVEDAKIKIDHFLDEYKDPPLPAFKSHIVDSLGFYVAASAAWNAKASKSYGGLLENPYVQRCAPLQEVLIREAGSEKSPTTKAIAWAVTIAYSGVRPLWECARSSLADAERALHR